MMRKVWVSLGSLKISDQSLKLKPASEEPQTGLLLLNSFFKHVMHTCIQCKLTVIMFYSASRIWYFP